MLPTKFQVSWPFESREKRKVNFQDGHHLGFRVETILSSFDLQVTPMLPTKFQVNRPFGSGEGAKHRFLLWSPRGHQEEEETDKSKQAQIEQTYEKH